MPLQTFEPAVTQVRTVRFESRLGPGGRLHAAVFTVAVGYEDASFDFVAGTAYRNGSRWRLQLEPEVVTLDERPWLLRPLWPADVYVSVRREVERQARMGEVLLTPTWAGGHTA